jgi:alkanesulfonate monooxygenase SsuD/methylene tetrahydromethanopterin reductase-like flavin-dependent oxidoreductase (luciferase family)
LFGVDRAERDAIFAEKLELFDRLNRDSHVTWSGRHRPALDNAEIAPRPAQEKLPVWIAASSPENLKQAATLGHPVALPLIVRREKPAAHNVAALSHYRTAWSEAGRPDANIRIATCSFMQVSADPAYIEDDYFQIFARHAAPIFDGHLDRPTYARLLSADGGLVAGNAQQVIEKILAIHEMVGDTRHMGHLDLGGQSFERIAGAIELLGTVVAPAVRKYASPPSTTRT